MPDLADNIVAQLGQKPNYPGLISVVEGRPRPGSSVVENLRRGEEAPP